MSDTPPATIRIATLDETIVANGGTLDGGSASSARSNRRAEEEPEKTELSDEQRQRVAGVLLG